MPTLFGQDAYEVRVQACTQDCPFYRRDDGPAPPHIHVPTYVVLRINEDGTRDILVPSDHVDPAGWSWVPEMEKWFPWFYGQGNRAPIATLVP